MKKIYILFSIVLLISSCSSNENKEEKLNIEESPIVEEVNINDEEINSEDSISSWENWFLSNTVWDSSSDIVDSYYDGDLKDKIAIKSWLWDESNEKSSFTWDIIEFLDYCENNLDNIDSISKLQDFMISDNMEIFKEITDSNKKIDDLEFRKLFVEYLDNPETWDLSVIYGTMSLDIIDDKNIECKEYIKNYTSN